MGFSPHPGLCNRKETCCSSCRFLWREAYGYRGISFRRHLFLIKFYDFWFSTEVEENLVCFLHCQGCNLNFWATYRSVNWLYRPLQSNLRCTDLQRQQCRGTESLEAAEACTHQPATILWEDVFMQGQYTFQENKQPQEFLSWFCLKTWLCTCICSLKTEFLHHFCSYRPGLLKKKWCLK